MQNQKYYHGLDLFKGSLILFVILGHVIRGQLDETLSRYIIYGFHMPLFIAVSGFLIDFDRLKKISYRQLFEKYFYRIIIPWILAVTVYYLITAPKGFHPQYYINGFIHPYYHLWYIPAILFYVFLTALTVKIDISSKFLIVISLSISLVGYFAYLRPSSLSLFSNTFILTFCQTFRPQFYCFFCFGVYLRSNRKLLNINTFLLLLLSCVSIVSYILNFFNPNLILCITSFYTLNIFLVILLVKVVTINKLPRVEFLEWIGINSLPIYLWHVLPLAFIESKYLKTENLLSFYSVCITSEVCTIALIAILIRFKLINKIVFGAISK